MKGLRWASEVMRKNDVLKTRYHTVERKLEDLKKQRHAVSDAQPRKKISVLYVESDTERHSIARGEVEGEDIDLFCVLSCIDASLLFNGGMRFDICVMDEVSAEDENKGKRFCFDMNCDKICIYTDFDLRDGERFGLPVYRRGDGGFVRAVEDLQTE